MNAVYSPSENSIIQSLFSEIEDLKTRIISLETEKSEVKAELSKAQKLSLFKLLAQDNEIEEDVQTWFDSMLIKSELRPIKRIAELETVTGKNDYSDFEDDEEREPTLPEKISTLTERVDLIESKPISGNIPTDLDLSPTTKTEVRATLLVEDLKESGKDHYTNHDIIHFLKAKLPDSCALSGNIQNIRKVKQDVLRAASAMYPNIFLNKKKTGRKEVRLILGS